MLLKNIQFLRGAAALLVVLYHLAPHFLNTSHALQKMHAFFVQFGYAGVDVFFVISGYVIWISTHGNSQKKTPVEFAYNRAARIYLGYWPYFLLVIAVVWYFSPVMFESANMVGSFFLTELTIPKLILKVAWTLSFELYFYLIFAFCLLFSKRLNKAFLLFFAVVIVLVQTYAVLILGVYAEHNIATASSFYLFFFSPFCLQFLAGVAIAVYFEKYRLKHLKTLLLVGLSLFAFTLWYQRYCLVDGHQLSVGYYTPMRVLLFGSIAVILVAVLVELELRNKNIWPRFGAWFGDASYSLYLSHTVILFVLSHLGLMAWGRLGQWQHVLVVVIILSTILLYSVVHYRLVELPLMQWARRKGQLIFKH